MRPDAEIVIAGAGCAGLSLAVALANASVPGRVLLLDPRTAYTRDRTWCFWNTEAHPFASAISHQWSSWRVSAGGREALRGSQRYGYCHIAGDNFYRSALAQVERAPEQELRLGITVRDIASHASGLLAVETDAGRVLARRVFDSRPPSRGGGVRPPVFLQRFVGWHVRTVEACFDPETVELMGFLPSDRPGRVRFLYLLPFSPTEALVEMTYLDPPELPVPEYERELEAWLGERASSWEVLYAERGTLPMGGSRVSPAPGGAVPIGVRGGRLKPSSGYGFLRMQRHSRAIARALREGRPVPLAAEPPLYGWMDAVFLEALRQRPEAAPDLFLRMFQAAEPDPLVRFLSEGSRSLGEVLRVAWLLPKRPMVGAAARAALRGARGKAAHGSPATTAAGMGAAR